MRRTTLILVLLLGTVRAGDEAPAEKVDLAAARRAMQAQLEAGDLLKEQGDLDGAIREYRKAVDIFEKAIRQAAAAEGVEAGKPPGEGPPPDDGTPEGRARLAQYYAKVLGRADAGAQVRYEAAVQLGELRLADTRDALVKALESDPDQLVRRAAAWALGRLGNEGAPAVAALIGQVGSEWPYVGYMADLALIDIAKACLGEAPAFGFKASLGQAERKAVQAKWEAWYAEHEAKLAPAPAGEK